MPSKTSLKSHLALLDGAGGVSALPVKAPPFNAQTVVLARERCLFERLETAKGLSRRAAESAARLHAQTAAPYQRSGAAVTRQGQAFGIWWWDAGWVAERLEEAGLDPAAKILPEPLARASGEGWRVAKAASGYEAQLWRGGFLIADLWKKTPFSTADWIEFVRVQPDQTGAEFATLTPFDPPYTLRSPYRRMLISDWTPERTVKAAAAIAAIVLISATGYFLGESFGLTQSAKRYEADAALFKTKMRGGSGQAGVSDLIALKTALEAPDALAMLTEAQSIVGPYGFKPLGFQADAKRARLILPIEAKDQLTVIASELEASSYFEDVRPILDRDKGRLVIDMTPSGARRPAKSPSPAVPKDDLLTK